MMTIHINTENLADLTGSTKQIAWASGIRAGFIAACEHAGSLRLVAEMVDNLRDPIRIINQAKFYGSYWDNADEAALFVEFTRDLVSDMLAESAASYWIDNAQVFSGMSADEAAGRRFDSSRLSHYLSARFCEHRQAQMQTRKHERV
jgi:hypothetical protein